MYILTIYPYSYIYIERTAPKDFMNESASNNTIILAPCRAEMGPRIYLLLRVCIQHTNPIHTLYICMLRVHVCVCRVKYSHNRITSHILHSYACSGWVWWNTLCARLDNYTCLRLGWVKSGWFFGMAGNGVCGGRDPSQRFL